MRRSLASRWFPIKEKSGSLWKSLDKFIHGCSFFFKKTKYVWCFVKKEVQCSSSIFIWPIDQLLPCKHGVVFM